MNIEGLSETTLEKLIGHGWIHTFADLYELEQHRDAILQTDGFGEKSFERLQAAIEKSRTCTLAKFIAGLGIPTVGRHAGRALERCFAGSWEAFEAAIQKGFDFTQLPDFGAVMQENIYTWVRGRRRSKALASAVGKNSIHKGDDTYEYYERIPAVRQNRCGDRQAEALYARRHPE